MNANLPGNLRINADDFGLTPTISRAIAQSVEAGWVNSISVMPFSDPESAEIFAALSNRSDVKIGAHLTFLEIPLLTRPKNFANGIPPVNYRDFLRQWLAGRISGAAVYSEWKAQLLLLRSRLPKTMGISHLDSHQHIHLMPGLWKPMLRLQREFNIPRLRVPRENRRPAYAKQPPFGLALQALAALRSSASDETFFGVGTSMGFTAEAYRTVAEEIVRNAQTQFELMIHPDQTPRGRAEMEELRKWLGFLEGALKTARR